MVVGSEAVTTHAIPQSSTDVSLHSRLNAPTALSREDFKKQKELEEARKSGLIPAEKDEEGRDINPHIPQYIAKAPWYLSRGHLPSLKHQRFRGDVVKNNLSQWYNRGLIKSDTPILKYRKGACANCGAITHKEKECTERPRVRGAKWTGVNICPDEILVKDSSELQLDFDGKRDPYGGYDPAAYRLVIRDFELADQERKRRKALQLHDKSATSHNTKETKKTRQGSSQSDDTDTDKEDNMEVNEDDDEGVKVKEFDQTNAPVGMKDDHTRTTTMNLRIREDTAKYLFNLDVNSAFYDPKTRSMRDNPMRHLKESEQGIYKGDNAMRNTEESRCVTKMEIFSWEAYKHNVNVHAQAQPTQLELMHKEFHRKQQRLVEQKRNKLLQKYGGVEHLDAPHDLLLSQSEVFQEFNPTDGRIIIKKNCGMVKSKYNEDSLFGEHTCVWGSWYDKKDGSWGYRCCHEKDRTNPECTPLPTTKA